MSYWTPGSTLVRSAPMSNSRPACCHSPARRPPFDARLNIMMRAAFASFSRRVYAPAPRVCVRATAVGWGYDVWLQSFCAQWRAAYDAAFPPKPGSLERDFFVMSPGPGAFELL